VCRFGKNLAVSGAQETGFSGRTAWARNLETPLRQFLRTETGSAAVLLAATILALVWVNVDGASYEHVWQATFSLRLDSDGATRPVQYWVNSGLMTFFFLVVGLEARREFDMGELRERRRVTVPLFAGLCGMIVPALIFVAVNSGSGHTHGFGVAMSTDTAFALGMLALVGPRFPDRLRAFLLTVSVVDDVASLIVIGTVYTTDFKAAPLALAVVVLVVVELLARSGVQRGLVYFALGAVAWFATMKSGIDPVVVGLAMGLMTYASPAARVDLEHATDLFRLFREQPTPELARSASIGLQSAISPNERLAQLYHPWTSYVIVPLFALANAGIPIDTGFLGRAFSSPVTLGIVFGYVIGKPVGVTGASWLVTKLSRGRVRPPVGWAAVLGGGMVAGIGFTVSLLIAALAFHGEVLNEAKLGVLTAALASSVLTWLLFRATARLPAALKARALVGSAEVLIDLAVPVDPERDHIRGPAEAPVTLLEYGDLECPFCGQAEPVIRELLGGTTDLRYVWRHLPLNDVHPRAQLAAEATELAAEQGLFWEMHDLLLAHQDALRPQDLVGYAGELGLDKDEFADALRRHATAGRVAEDVDSADLSNVSGTPTFFVNGIRHQGAYDIDSLRAAVHLAKTRAAIAA
jgi:Na+/H+ antiporter NhaA